MMVDQSQADETTSEQPVAIFDLDGTLTTKDSFLAFLLTFGRRQSRYRAMATMPFLISAYLGKLMKDYELKQRLIGDFFSDTDPEIVEEHVRWFCENWLPRHSHPVGNRLLEGHLEQEHRVILLSASPEIFVPQIAEALGIKEVVCTRVKRVDGVWQGRLDGRNCKGKEKLNAIQRWLRSKQPPADSYSYGDSKSDLHVLQWVRRGAWIRRNDFVPIGDDPRSIFPWTDC